MEVTHSVERKLIKAMYTIKLQILQNIEAIHTIKLQVQQNLKWKLYTFSLPQYLDIFIV